MKFTFVESVGKQKLLRNEKTVDFIDDTGITASKLYSF